MSLVSCFESASIRTRTQMHACRHSHCICHECMSTKEENTHIPTHGPEPTAENKQTEICLKALKIRAACKLFFWQYPSFLTHHSTTIEIQRQIKTDRGSERGRVERKGRGRREMKYLPIIELIGEGLIKSVYIPCWASFCQRLSTPWDVFWGVFTPKWLPLINRDLRSPYGQLYSSPCACPPAFVLLSSPLRVGCEYSGCSYSPTVEPSAVRQSSLHVLLTGYNAQASLARCRIHRVSLHIQTLLFTHYSVIHVVGITNHINILWNFASRGKTAHGLPKCQTIWWCVRIREWF